jgi:hypothetical protein
MGLKQKKLILEEQLEGTVTLSVCCSPELQIHEQTLNLSRGLLPFRTQYKQTLQFLSH